MVRSTKTLLNILFLLMAVLGSTVIFSYKGVGEIVRVLPLIIIAAYSLILMGSLSDCWDDKIALKRINTVYLLGFLFTVLALLSMFFRLKEIAGIETEQQAVAVALSFLFMALTAGFASLAMRFLVWKLYNFDNMVVSENIQVVEEDFYVPA